MDLYWQSNVSVSPTAAGSALQPWRQPRPGFSPPTGRGPRQALRPVGLRGNGGHCVLRFVLAPRTPAACVQTQMPLGSGDGHDHLPYQEAPQQRWSGSLGPILTRPAPDGAPGPWGGAGPLPPGRAPGNRVTQAMLACDAPPKESIQTPPEGRRPNSAWTPGHPSAAPSPPCVLSGNA